MAKPEAFNELRAGNTDELIVVADYAATGRPAASFHDLVPLLATEHTVWETTPVPRGREAGMTGDDQARRWLDEIHGSGLKVRALMGFCGGGVYAGVMADQIAAWQGDRPRLVLFDPGFAERRMLTEHIENFCRRLAKAFDPEQTRQAQDAIAAADAAAPGPLDLAARLGALAHEILLPAIIRAGWSQRASLNTTELVVGYLSWLAGAVELDPRPAWQAAAAVNSSNPDIGLHIIPEPERSTLVAEAHFFDVPHAQLLRTAEVAATVDKLLA